MRAATAHAARVLHEFLTKNHGELIKRCREKAGLRYEPKLAPATVEHGVPLFLQQLEDILRIEQTTDERLELAATGPTPSRTAIGRAAALHGIELQRLGFTVDQVVHGYGDVCQVVTSLAVEQRAAISPDEFRTLNRCLDNAIADAVTAYGAGNVASAESQAETLSGRLDAFGDEHRRLVDIASQAHAAMKTGNIGLGGATGALLVHTLEELRLLPARILPEIRKIAAKNAIASS
jgi:hypothetical protein